MVDALWQLEGAEKFSLPSWLALFKVKRKFTVIEDPLAMCRSGAPRRDFMANAGDGYDSESDFERWSSYSDVFTASDEEDAASEDDDGSDGVSSSASGRGERGEHRGGTGHRWRGGGLGGGRRRHRFSSSESSSSDYDDDEDLEPIDASPPPETVSSTPRIQPPRREKILAFVDYCRREVAHRDESENLVSTWDGASIAAIDASSGLSFLMNDAFFAGIRRRRERFKDLLNEDLAPERRAELFGLLIVEGFQDLSFQLDEKRFEYLTVWIILIEKAIAAGTARPLFEAILDNGNNVGESLRILADVRRAIPKIFAGGEVPWTAEDDVLVPYFRSPLDRVEALRRLDLFPSDHEIAAYVLPLQGRAGARALMYMGMAQATGETLTNGVAGSTRARKAHGNGDYAAKVMAPVVPEEKKKGVKVNKLTPTTILVQTLAALATDSPETARFHENVLQIIFGGSMLNLRVLIPNIPDPWEPTNPIILAALNVTRAALGTAAPSYALTAEAIDFAMNLLPDDLAVMTLLPDVPVQRKYQIRAALLAANLAIDKIYERIKVGSILVLYAWALGRLKMAISVVERREILAWFRMKDNWIKARMKLMDDLREDARDLFELEKKLIAEAFALATKECPVPEGWSEVDVKAVVRDVLGPAYRAIKQTHDDVAEFFEELVIPVDEKKWRRSGSASSL